MNRDGMYCSAATAMLAPRRWTRTQIVLVR
jgi:hypothetical protein